MDTNSSTPRRPLPTVMSSPGMKGRLFALLWRSKRLPKQLTSLSATHFQSPFIHLNEFKHRLHRAGRQPDFRQPFVQSSRAGATPAALGHERIPDFNFFFVRLTAMRKGPRQQSFVAAAFECLRFQLLIIDLEESAAT